MLKPKVTKYRVVEGDCLWKIAQAQYGNPTVWPEIAEVNQLPDPDLILIGMTLRLEPVHAHRYHPHSAHPGHGAAGAAKTPHSVGTNPTPPFRLDAPNAVDSGAVPKSAKPGQTVTPAAMPQGHLQQAISMVRGTGTSLALAVLPPAVRYKFDDLAAITLSSWEVDMVLRFIGEVSLQLKGKMTEVELSQRGTLTGKLKTQYDSEFGNLLGQVKVGFNSQTKAAQLSCNLAVAAKLDGQVFVVTQFEPIPPNRLKYSYKPRGIQGEFGKITFSGTFGFELEVILKGPGAPPSAEPMPEPEPAAVPLRPRPSFWTRNLADALVVAGTAIIIVDVVKDAATFGAGTVESPLSFSAAAALFAKAAAMAP
ncbi:MAG TPA: LysM domain-containing protein [Candidatus Sulfotelmatobacter sp.]|jgi:hypothetical protein